MKSASIQTTARLAGLSIALALFAGTVAGASAHEPGSAKGGATRLLPQPSPPAPSERIAMACPKCKSEFVRRTDVTTKGTQANTSVVERHLCPGCKTTISTLGHGKAKRDFVSHTCTSRAADSSACCETVAGDNPAAKGVE